MRLMVIILVLLSLSVDGQTSKVDSLTNVLGQQDDEYERFETLEQLIRHTWNDGKVSDALVYAKMQVQIAEELEDPELLAEAYMEASEVYLEMENFPMSRDFILKAIENYSTLKDWEKLAPAYDHLSLVYDAEGKYALAIEASRNAFDIYERLDDKSGMAYAYNDIGVIHYYMSSMDDALEMYQKSRDLMIETQDTFGVALYYNNAGNIYGDQGDYDKAIELYWKGYELDEQRGSIEGQAITMSNIGETYAAAGEYEKAMEAFDESIRLARSDDNKWAETNPLRAKALLFREQGRYEEAIELVRRALKLAEEIGARAEISEGYLVLSQIYEEAGMPDKALEAHKQFSQLEDSLFNRDNAMIIHEMETRYKSEAKDQQLKLLEKQNELEAARRKEEEARERNLRYILIGGVAALVIIIILVGNSLRMKRRSNKELAEAFAQIEEKNKDITDSIRYAKRIQEAVLPSDEETNRILGDHFILFKPRDIVSGDFYWVFEKGDDKYFMVGDCTGHGVPGAFVSMLCVNALNHAVIEHGKSEPGEILTEVNNLVLQGLKKEGANVKVSDGMDTVICRLNKTTGKLHFAGAQNPVIVTRGDEDAIEIRGDKTPIGGRTEPNYKFTTHEVDVNKGNMIYTFSDGYADQFGGDKGKKFKHANLRRLLTSLQHDETRLQYDALNNTITDWKRDLEQLDDICLIGVRV